MVLIGQVAGFEVVENRDSEHPVRMLSVEATDVDDVQDVEQIGHGGEDFNPAPGSFVLVLDISEAFRFAIGVDDGITPEVLPGEKEIYSVAAGEKLARMLLDVLGNIDLQPGELPGLDPGVIKLGGDDRNASGVGDTVTIDATTDPALFTWLNAVATATGATPAPTSITGKISSGADKVKLQPVPVVEE
jgi:hypothetical protein